MLTDVSLSAGKNVSHISYARIVDLGDVSVQFLKTSGAFELRAINARLHGDNRILNYSILHGTGEIDSRVVLAPSIGVIAQLTPFIPHTWRYKPDARIFRQCLKIVTPARTFRASERANCIHFAVRNALMQELLYNTRYDSEYKIRREKLSLCSRIARCIIHLRTKTRTLGIRIRRDALKRDTLSRARSFALLVEILDKMFAARRK